MSSAFCSVCKKQNIPLFLCGECKQIVYCSRECQVENLKTDKFHRAQCKRPQPKQTSRVSLETELEDFFSKFQALLPQLDFETQFAKRQQVEQIPVVEAMAKEAEKEKEIWSDLDENITDLLEKLLDKAGASCEQISYIKTELENYDTKNKKVLSEFFKKEPTVVLDNDANPYAEMDEHLTNILAATTSITGENLAKVQTKAEELNDELGRKLLTDTTFFYAQNIREANRNLDAVGGKPTSGTPSPPPPEPVDGIIRDFLNGMKASTKEAGSKILREMASLLMWKSIDPSELPTFSERSAGGEEGLAATQRYEELRALVANLAEEHGDSWKIRQFKRLNEWAESLETLEIFENDPDKETTMSDMLELVIGVAVVVGLGWYAIFNFKTPEAAKALAEQNIQNMINAQNAKVTQFAARTEENLNIKGMRDVLFKVTSDALVDVQEQDVYVRLKDEFNQLTSTHAGRMTLLQQMLHHGIGDKIVQEQLKQSIAHVKCLIPDEAFQRSKELAEYVVQSGNNTDAAMLLNNLPTIFNVPAKLNSTAFTSCSPDVWINNYALNLTETITTVAKKIAKDKVSSPAALSDYTAFIDNQSLQLMNNLKNGAKHDAVDFFVQAEKNITSLAQISGVTADIESQFLAQGAKKLYSLSMAQELAYRDVFKQALEMQQIPKAIREFMHEISDDKKHLLEARAAFEALKNNPDPFRNPVQAFFHPILNPVKQLFDKANISGPFLHMWRSLVRGNIQSLYDTTMTYLNKYQAGNRTLWDTFFSLSQMAGSITKMLLILYLIWSLCVFLEFRFLLPALFAVYNLCKNLQFCSKKIPPFQQEAKEAMKKYNRKNIHVSAESHALSETTFESLAKFAKNGLPDPTESKPGSLADYAKKGLSGIGVGVGIALSFIPTALSLFNLISSGLGIACWVGQAVPSLFLNAPPIADLGQMVYWFIYSSCILYTSPTIQFFNVKKYFPRQHSAISYITGRWIPPRAVWSLMSKAFLINETMQFVVVPWAELFTEFLMKYCIAEAFFSVSGGFSITRIVIEKGYLLVGGVSVVTGGALMYYHRFFKNSQPLLPSAPEQRGRQLVVETVPASKSSSRRSRSPRSRKTK